MQRYAWWCRTCGERVPSDPRTWPMLADFHQLVHRLETEVRDLARALVPGYSREVELELVAA